MSGVKLGARHEAIVETEGETFTLVWTNRALAEAERGMDKALLGLRVADLRLDDIATLVRVALTAGRREAGPAKAATADDAWRLIDRIGIGEATSLVGDGIREVLAYAPAEGESDPPA